MRSKLLVFAVLALVGCSEEETTPAAVAKDAAPETVGLDVSNPPDSTTDTRVDSATDAGSDTAMPDTAMPDTAMDTRDTALDTADTAVVDSAPDTSADTAVDAAVDAPAFGPAPTCDGTIAAGEYGVHVNGNNQVTNTTTSNTWYMTWDDTSLYLALANANVAEGAVIYIDANVVAPPSGGTNSDGNLAGYTYDATKLATLPFRANLVAYAKSTYREYRTSDGSGGWSTPTTAFGCFASSGTTRELSIPWSALGGRPSSFGVLAYVTSGAGFVYAQIPTANPGGNIGTTATATKYFHVGATGPGSTATAFADER